MSTESGQHGLCPLFLHPPRRQFHAIEDRYPDGLAKPNPTISILPPPYSGAHKGGPKDMPGQLAHLVAGKVSQKRWDRGRIYGSDMTARLQRHLLNFMSTNSKPKAPLDVTPRPANRHPPHETRLIVASFPTTRTRRNGRPRPMRDTGACRFGNGCRLILFSAHLHLRWPGQLTRHFRSVPVSGSFPSLRPRTRPSRVGHFTCSLQKAQSARQNGSCQADSRKVRRSKGRAVSGLGTGG